MNELNKCRNSQRGGAGIKAIFVILILGLCANAGFNYVPVAYQGANFRQEMDTAVVKGLAASGQMRPLDVVKSSIERAAAENQLPPDAVIEIKPVNGIVEAHVAYTKNVPVMPFGMYNYRYDFNYVARPTGYLLK